MIRLLGICAVSMIVGAGLDWGLRSSDSATADDHAAGSCTGVSQLVNSQMQSAPSGANLAEMRAVIREELAAASMSKTPAITTPTQVTETAAPPTAELIAQHREALQEIQTIIASGKWDVTERAQLHHELAILDRKEAEQAMQELVRALNNGTLRPTADVPL